ncbi:MAG: Crp/Fnr family transcriptional regulator [Cryomorphaceae bacterium]|nr:Crp/Fnr family transcriptional regulator [Cryomorphaceae bacterium]
MSSAIPVHCKECSVHNNCVLGHLTPEELEQIDRDKGCSIFKKGQIIMPQGSKPSGVYCVFNGKVKFTRLGSEGRDHIIRLGTKGDLLGYRSVLANESLSASIVALEDTQVCFIPKSLLLNFINENVGFSLSMMQQACQDLGESGKMITNLAQKNVRQRLAEVLLMLNAKFGKDQDDFLDVKLSREEYANMVGTATETLIRLLSDFKIEGLIETNVKRVKLVDEIKLANIAQLEN